MIRHNSQEVEFTRREEAEAARMFEDLLDEGKGIEEAVQLVEKAYVRDNLEPDFYVWLRQ
jgi:hypothetical protein